MRYIPRSGSKTHQSPFSSPFGQLSDITSGGFICVSFCNCYSDVVMLLLWVFTTFDIPPGNVLNESSSATNGNLTFAEVFDTVRRNGEALHMFLVLFKVLEGILQDSNDSEH